MVQKNGSLNGYREILMGNGIASNGHVTGRNKSAFTHLLLEEMAVGSEGIIAASTMLRQKDKVFITEDAIVSPTDYWNTGHVKIKRLTAGKGPGSFALEAKYVKIVPFEQRQQWLPGWWMRFKGFFGPFALPMERISNHNWWHTFDVEELVGMLVHASLKRKIPDWFPEVKEQVIARLKYNKVLKFNDVPHLMKQVSGIRSLDDVCIALKNVLEDDLARYQGLFSDDTVTEILNGLYEIPEQRDFVKDLEARGARGRKSIGFALNGQEKNQ